MISPFEMKTTRCLAVVLGLVFVGLTLQNVFWGFDDPDSEVMRDRGDVPLPVEVALVQESTEGPPSKLRYHKELEKGRQLAKELREISLRFFDSSLAESYEWKAKWPEATKKLKDHKPVLQEAAIDWFLECESPDVKLVEIASAISNEVYIAGDMEMAWTLLQKIRQFIPQKDDILLLRRIALVAVKTNRYEQAVEFLSKPGAKDSIEELESQVDKNLLIMCPLMIEKWNAEKPVRDKELEADDLPRVKLEMSTGDVVVELFENEAPEAVASFITLVESGFYDDSVFLPVVSSVVAQTGYYNRTKKDPMDYTIKNESRLPSARDHFVGSLSMVGNKGGRGDASSIFAIMMVPNPDLDWDRTEEDEVSQTVFGRVVSGMDRVFALPATVEIDPETLEEKPIRNSNPGYIVKATVIRKRDHQYTFEKTRIENK